MTKLTATALSNMQVGDTLYDDQVTGLHARRTGKRISYYLYFRTQSRLERRPKVGDHGVITLPQAREIARKWLLMNSQGLSVKPGVTSADKLTLADLHEKWQKEHKPKLKRGSQMAMEGYWQRNILPVLGKHRVSTIERRPIAEMLEKIAETRPTTANRVQALLSKALSLAESWEMRPPKSNPCSTIPRRKESKRQRHLSLDELQRFGAVLTAWDNGNDWQRRASAFYRLLLLTGARKNEIATAKREWIDFENRLLRLPDSKTGKKEIPLSMPALARIRVMIEECPKSEWLCPGRHPYAPIKNDWNTWKAIMKESGIKDFRIHDLRHSFASIALSYGIDLMQIGQILGHRDSSCTERYTHLMDHKRSESVNAISGTIERLMLPAPVIVGANILAEAKIPAIVS